MNLAYNTRVTRGLNGQSSNATSTGNVLDMAGFEGVMFILMGSSLLEGSTDIELQAKGSTSSTGTYTTYASAAASTMATGTYDRKMLVLDVYKPLKRYIKPVVAGASSDVKFCKSVAAIQYGARTPGSTQLRDSTYVGNVAVVVGATS